MIKNDCNINCDSYSKFGHNYELQEGIKYNSDQANSYLAGSYKFKVLEIEVYQIIDWYFYILYFLMHLLWIENLKTNINLLKKL